MIPSNLYLPKKAKRYKYRKYNLYNTNTGKNTEYMKYNLYNTNTSKNTEDGITALFTRRHSGGDCLSFSAEGGVHSQSALSFQNAKMYKYKYKYK